jgi:hypothetical protein
VYESHELGLEIRIEQSKTRQIADNVTTILAFAVRSKYRLRIAFSPMVERDVGC